MGVFIVFLHVSECVVLFHVYNISYFYIIVKLFDHLFLVKNPNKMTTFDDLQRKIDFIILKNLFIDRTTTRTNSLQNAQL